MGSARSVIPNGALQKRPYLMRLFLFVIFNTNKITNKKILINGGFMNGKSNLLIKCIVCFLAYFYSVNANAALEWTYSKGIYKPTCVEAVLATYWTSGPPAGYGVREVVGSPNLAQVYNSSGWTQNQQCISRTAVTPAPTSTPVPTSTPEPCPLGKIRIKGVCQDNCMLLKGQSDYDSENFSYIPKSGQKACVRKCQRQTSALTCATIVNFGGTAYNCAGKMSYTGEFCENSNQDLADSETALPSPTPYIGATNPPPVKLTPAPEKPETNCIQKGMSFGVVNGQVVCVPPTSDTPIIKTDSKTTTSTDPSGVKTETKTDTTTTTDGSGKTTTQTTTTTKTGTGGVRPGGTVCTDPNGCTDVSGSGTSESDSEYCKKNPTDEKCKNGGSVSASCEEFTCKSDDVIACEIAKVNWKSYCFSEKSKEEFDEKWTDFKDSDLGRMGEKILSGGDASDIQAGLSGDGSNDFDLKDGFDSDGFLSCGTLSDKTFYLDGKTISLPFSKMNYWLDLMGKIAVIFTLVVAARIAIGGNS